MKSIINKLSEVRDSYIEDYIIITEDLMMQDEVRKMKEYIHHGNCSCYRHCFHVGYFNYIICDKLGLDKVKAARAGFLHDMFLYDWHTHAKETGNMFHGITHPEVALKNASSICRLSKKEKNIIKSHMWPLTLHHVPRSKEAYITTYTDKLCGFFEKLDQIIGR